MAKIYELRNKPVIDDDGDYQNQPTLAGTTTEVIASARLKNGLRAFLVKIGNAVGATANEPIEWTLKVNGAPLDKRFTAFTNMITEPSNPEAQLPKEYELPQGALVELVAYNPNVDAIDVTGMFQIYYTDL